MTSTMAKKFRYIAAGGLSDEAETVVSPRLRPQPLTPALFLGERESTQTALEGSNDLRFADRLATIPPLPKGEGRGEGKQDERPEMASKLNWRCTSQGA